MVRGDRIQDVHTKYVNTDSASGNAMEAFSGDSRDARAYGYWVALWVGELQRVVVPGGVVGMFTDWRQLPTTTDAIQAGGMVWRGDVVALVVAEVEVGGHQTATSSARTGTMDRRAVSRWASA
jgi:site-specific DNA-methyltransferase (adenine-specific)